jgi:hypothetical protein
MSTWSTYNEICTGSGVGDIEPIILTPEEGAPFGGAAVEDSYATAWYLWGCVSNGKRQG